MEYIRNSMMHLRRFVGLSIIVILALGSPVAARTAIPNAVGSTAKATQDNGKIVADSGFRPDKDGFLFENYGANIQVTNLTAADLRRMFGEQVCARVDGDKCDLTPPAQQFMDQVNAAMSGGHCEGMAVLSSLFYTGGAKTADFGGNNIG